MQLESEVGPNGTRIGYTVRLRVPPKFTPSFSLGVGNMTESSVLVALDQQIHYSFACDPRDLMLGLGQFSRRYLRRSSLSLADGVIKKWPAGATLVSAPLEIITGVQGCVVATDPDGLSLRVMSAYSVTTAEYQFRVDVRFGVTPVAYVPTAFERELVSILMDALKELERELEEFRMAA